MPIKIFTLRFVKSMDGFDDAKVRAFMYDKNVIEVRDPTAGDAKMKSLVQEDTLTCVTFWVTSLK